MASAAMYDTVPYKANGRTYTVFLCNVCSRAWKLHDPVEAWRVKSLMTHFAAHAADRATDAEMAVPGFRRGPEGTLFRKVRKADVTESKAEG